MNRAVSITVVIIFGLLVLECLGLWFPVALAGAVLIGWAEFLFGVLPRIGVNWEGVATGTVCLVALGIGFHLFVGWLYRARGVLEQPNGEVRHWRARWSAALVGVVVLMFVAGTAAIGLTHQTAWLVTSPEPLVQRGSFREMAAEAETRNRLKQLGLAAHTHHDSHKQFPQGGRFDGNGNGLHGWQTAILPYLEEQKLFNQIDHKVSWRDPRNRPHFTTPVNGFTNPALDQVADAEGLALSHFAANSHVLHSGPSLKLDDFKDGTANTLLFGEAAGNFKPWGHPANWRDPARGIHSSRDGFGSPKRHDGAYFAFADGSVRFVHTKTSPEVLRALATPRGGEKIPDDWDQ